MNAPLTLAGHPPASQVTDRLAALPMYDLPELAEANDRIWAALAERLCAAGVIGTPARLARSVPLHSLWTAPNLLLAQTCGYPLIKDLRGRVKLVATPRYRADGCKGPYHRSAVVVRQGFRANHLADLRGARLAVNDWNSGSGMNLLRAVIAPLAGGRRFFGQVEITGSHAASVAAVADGDADTAAIDCVTWAHLERHRPQLTRKLRILSWTVKSPGLPLITTGRASAGLLATLRAALEDLSRDPRTAAARRELLLDGFSALPEAHYQAALHWERVAADLGYPNLE